MESSKGKRLFIAFKLPQEIKVDLNKLLKELKSSTRGVKWCDSQNLHITLHFLGSQDEKSELAIISIMQSLAGKLGQIKFKLGQIGGFPDLKNPRVIFIACQQINGGSAVSWRSLLGFRLVDLGLAPDRRAWQTHLTLGRVKDGVKINLPVNLAVPKAEFALNTFELMASKLTPSGAEYKIVASFAL